MNGDQTPAAETLPDGSIRVLIPGGTALLMDGGSATKWQLDPAVDTIASRALGTDMAIAQEPAPPTHRDPTSVAWPEAIACPYKPAGIFRGWYEFEERYPPPGFRRAVQHISERQIEHAAFVDPLQLRHDWLAEQFPVPGGGALDWDKAAVVAWMRHHIDLSCQRRQARHHPPVPPVAEARPVPAAPAPQAAPRTWRMEFKPLSALNPIPRICSLHVERDEHGRAVIAVVFLLPNGRDQHGAKVKLPTTAATELGEVLAGMARVKP